MQVFSHIGKMQIFTNNQAKNVVIKNVLILKIQHTIFNLRDTEFAMCMVVAILKRSERFIDH
jgi:hypothetical protein